MKEIPTPLTDSTPFMDTKLFLLARQLERDRAELLEWCKAHYAAEEGPGQTDRPAFIELRSLLERMK